MSFHRDLTYVDVHGVHAFEYANAVARAGATGLAAADVGKVARQLDDNSFWVLQNHSPVTWAELTSTGAGFVPTSRLVTAGAGLTGGGDLSADRTFDVGANADGSIVVNANDVQVGVLATDAQHGARGGGTQHAAAVAGSPGTAGFITGVSQQKLNNLVEVLDESVSLGVGKTKLNFVGAGVSAADVGGGQIDVTIPGSGTATITVKDEGSALVPDKTKLNFVGPGLTATTDGGDTSQANVTLSTAAPGSIQPDDTASAGSADSLARSDHRHAIAADVAGAVTVGAAAAEGVSTAFARADHTHSVAAPAAPADVDRSAASAGVSTAPARADHKHDVSTAAPAATGVATASGAGTATTLARSDHTHQSNTAPANVTKAAAAIGTSGEPARADHKHDVTTAAAVNVGDTNAEGASTSLARADHVHHAMYPAWFWGNANVSSTTTTRYLTPGFIDAVAPTTAMQFRVPAAGTLRNLRVRHGTTAGNGNNIVYTVRVNGVATALAVTLASTAADGSNLVNTVAVAAGDLLDVEVTKAASVGTSPSDIAATLEVFV